MNQTFQLIETDLASRRSAAVFRSMVESSLRNGSTVLDFSRVESVSESYADELIGVLIEHYTLSWVFSRLQVIGACPAVVHSITQAIRYRLEKAAAAPDPIRTKQCVQHIVDRAVRDHQLAFSS